MPHQCVRCGKFYEDGSNQILLGCSCGAKLFFFVKKDAVQKVKEMTSNLTKEEKKEIESDVYELIDEQQPEKPIILDIESIRILEPGKFELDLVQLFKKEPLVYKVGDGKYMIDIVSIFGKHLANKESKKSSISKSKTSKAKKAVKKKKR